MTMMMTTTITSIASTQICDHYAQQLAVISDLKRNAYTGQ